MDEKSRSYPPVEGEKIADVARGVKNADELLKLAQATRIFDSLESPTNSFFLREGAIKFFSVAVGALVGAALLVMSGVSDNFWDAYNFAKEAKLAKEAELETAESQLVEYRDNLEEARVSLLTLEEQRDTAETQRDEALSQIKSARDELANLQEQAELAQISSVRMYTCDRQIVSEIFDELSRYHNWSSLGQAVQGVQSPELYLSVQFISDQTFQYVANIRSGGRPIDSRTEFGQWQANGFVVEARFTMSKRGRPSERIQVERIPRQELIAYARGQRDRVCTEDGLCFYRNSTCRPETE